MLGAFSIPCSQHHQITFGCSCANILLLTSDFLLCKTGAYRFTRYGSILRSTSGYIPLNDCRLSKHLTPAFIAGHKAPSMAYCHTNLKPPNWRNRVISFLKSIDNPHFSSCTNNPNVCFRSSFESSSASLALVRILVKAMNTRNAFSTAASNPCDTRYPPD